MADRHLDVAEIARLARIRLTADETLLFQEQLGHVIAFADKLREVDVTAVEASAHSSPIFDVFREDETRAGFTQEEALRNAPQQAKGLFVVTKVVE